jgi:hypothetical protein
VLLAFTAGRAVSARGFVADGDQAARPPAARAAIARALGRDDRASRAIVRRDGVGDFADSVLVPFDGSALVFTPDAG